MPVLPLFVAENQLNTALFKKGQRELRKAK